jgi:phosphoenolpyruvate carboxykinase (ATP)
MRIDPNFEFAVPVAIEGVAPALLDPRRSWGDGGEYDVAASKLAALFAENRRRFAPMREAAE